MKELGIELRCYADPKQAAILDPAHRVMVNWETFYFASEEAAAEFGKKAWKSCGLLTDPVSRHRFRPTGKSPTTSHAGRTFYFENDTDLAAFMTYPDSLSAPNMAMLPKESP